MASKHQIDFIRQVLHPRVTRPQMGIALYPDVQGSTKIKVTVGATTISVNYGSTTEIVSFVGKTVEEVASSINRTSVPVKAVALSSGGYLASGDFVQTPADDFGNPLITVPDSFNLYDRTIDNGVVLRLLRYTVRYTATSKIQLLPPYKASYNAPWYPRISVGSFSQEFKGRRFKFDIPEYSQQTWSTLYGMPFKDVRSASVQVIDVNVLQVARYPIHWTDDNLIFYVDGSPVSNIIVEDIDVNNGLIYIRPGSFPNGSVTVDYTYLEKDYLYPYLNINAHFSQNPSLIDKFVIFYLKPVEGTVSVKSNRTVFHKVADNIQEGLDSIDIDNPDVPIAVIGAYSIQQILSSDRVTILDTRSLGGGLVTKNGLKSPVHVLDNVFTVNPELENKKDIEEVYDGTESFWDAGGNYDGKPYPGAAAITIGVPETLRIDYKDSFVNNKVTKFVAAGVYPIVEFYNDSNEYLSGFSKDVSCVLNTGLQHTVGNTTGLDWLRNKMELPGGTVLSPWPIGFNLPTPVVDRLDNSYALTIGPDSSMYQHYLKSNPNAVITWEERTVLKSDVYTGQNLYTSWESQQVVDSRDVIEGQLAKGAIQFSNPSITKQYRKINVFAPYITYSGQLLERVDEEIRKIINVTTGYAGRNYQYSQIVNDVSYSGLGLTNISGTYLGHHPRLRSFFDLAITGFNIRKVTEHMLRLNSSIYDPTGIFQIFNPITDKYEKHLGPNYTYTDNLKTLAASVRYIAAFNDTVNPIYTGNIALLTSAWANLAGANQGAAPAAHLLGLPLPYTYISPDYYVPASGYFLKKLLDLPSNPGEINPRYEDHRITELLPALSDFCVAWTGDSILTGIPSRLKDTFNFAYSYLPLAIVGAKTNLGAACANTWYNTFDRYGEFLGSLLYNTTKMVDNYLTIRAGNRSGLSWTGASDLDLMTYAGKIRSALNLAYTGFSEALFRGGGLDTNIPQLLYSYGWTKKASQDIYAQSGSYFDNLSGLRAAFNHSDVDRFYGLFQSGVSIYTKNIVTREGDIQQKNCINQNPGPYTGSPPSKIFDMLGLATYLDPDKFTHLTQGVFCTVTGNYSYSGCYPLDVDLNGQFGGAEAEVLDGLLSLRNHLTRTAPVAFTGIIPNPYNPVFDDFEYINTGYTNVRGVNFTPYNYESVNGTGIYSGASNTTMQWRFYQTGSTDLQLGYIRGLGLNSVVVFCGLYDYEKHFATGATGFSNEFIGKYRNFLGLASGHKLYVTPVMFDSTALTSGPTGNSYEYITNWVAMPPTTLRTSGWYEATGQYYVRDIVEASTGFDNILMFNLMNEPDPNAVSGLLRTGIDHIKSLTTGIPLTIGFAASIHRPGSYYTNWTLAYLSGGNSGLDVHSYHPYGIFKETFDAFTVLARESSATKPVLVTEFAGPTTAQLPQDVLRYAEATGVGWQFYNNIIAPTGSRQILNGLGGLVFYDGTVPNLVTVSGLHAAAVRAGAPTGGFIQFSGSPGYETGYFNPFPIGYSGRQLVDFFRDWDTKQRLSGSPLTGLLRTYQFKAAHISYTLFDLYYLCDGPFSFTGQYARNFFTTGEQSGILTMLSGFTHVDLLGVSGYGSATPAWFYYGAPPYTNIDLQAYDIYFSGLAKTIYGHITGKNMTVYS